MCVQLLIYLAYYIYNIHIPTHVYICMYNLVHLKPVCDLPRADPTRCENRNTKQSEPYWPKKSAKENTQKKKKRKEKATT